MGAPEHRWVRWIRRRLDLTQQIDELHRSRVQGVLKVEVLNEEQRIYFALSGKGQRRRRKQLIRLHTFLAAMAFQRGKPSDTEIIIVLFSFMSLL